MFSPICETVCNETCRRRNYKKLSSKYVEQPPLLCFRGTYCPYFSFLLLLIPVLMSTPVEIVFFLSLCPIQVCRDIDECDGINNGGCVANSICMNTPVSVNTIFHTLLAATFFGESAANSCSTI